MKKEATGCDDYGVMYGLALMPVLSSKLKLDAVVWVVRFGLHLSD